MYVDELRAMPDSACRMQSRSCFDIMIVLSVLDPPTRLVEPRAKLLVATSYSLAYRETWPSFFPLSATAESPFNYSDYF